MLAPAEKQKRKKESSDDEPISNGSNNEEEAKGKRWVCALHRTLSTLPSICPCSIAIGMCQRPLLTHTCALTLAERKPPKKKGKNEEFFSGDLHILAEDEALFESDIKDIEDGARTALHMMPWGWAAQDALHGC